MARVLDRAQSGQRFLVKLGNGTAPALGDWGTLLRDAKKKENKTLLGI